MRTLLFVVGGIFLWMAIIGVAKVFATQSGSSWIPTVVFGVLWFIVAGWNMWVGITEAGFTFTEELPIFLLIYLLPVATAVVVKFKILA